MTIYVTIKAMSYFCGLTLIIFLCSPFSTINTLPVLLELF